MVSSSGRVDCHDTRQCVRPLESFGARENAISNPIQRLLNPVQRPDLSAGPPQKFTLMPLSDMRWITRVFVRWSSSSRVMLSCMDLFAVSDGGGVSSEVSKGTKDRRCLFIY